MSWHGELLGSLVRALRLVDGRTFTWFGREVELFPRSFDASTASADALLLQGLTRFLYGNFYTQGRATPLGLMASPSATASPDFESLLSEANRGRGYWEPGWTLLSRDQTSAVLSNGELVMRAPLERVRSIDATSRGRLEVEVLRPKESTTESPGFYLAYGDRPLPSELPPLRLYWNILPEGSARLVSSVTSELNGMNAPFALKVLADENGYERNDSGVLYLPGPSYPRLMTVLATIHQRLEPWLRPGVPALTRSIAPGLGLAESPEGPTSFGEHRCRLLANGLVAAHAGGVRDEPSIVARVKEQFDLEGVPWERPYLCADTSPDYGCLRNGRSPRKTRGSLAGTGRDEGCDEPCRSIAELLIETAIRHGGCCTWIGLRTPQKHEGGEEELGSLGADLYSGTCGIALFLAEFAVSRRDRRAAETSLASMRHALAAAEAVDERLRLSLFLGWTGVALVGLYVGRLLADEGVAALARSLADECLSIEPGAEESDYLSGTAGAMVALIALSLLSGRDAFAERAVRMADRLLGVAVPGSEGCFWPHQALPGCLGLTGLSHGASGISMALLELDAVRRDPRLRRAAYDGFRYEDSWFDPVAQNWADLRGVKLSEAELSPGQLPSRLAWCHGAPGIGLSRVRAWELTGESDFREAALRAYATTSSATASVTTADAQDECLCHGVVGNLEALSLLGSGLSKDRPASQFHFRRAGGDDSVSRDERVPDPLRPRELGLMSGLAGVGHHLLRVRDSSVPPILLVRPGAFEARLRD